MSIKSIRLNAAIRTDIIKAMTESWEKSNPSPVDIELLDEKIGDFIWEFYYGKLDFSKIPSDMLHMEKRVSISCANKVYVFNMSVLRPYPTSPNRYGLRLIDALDTIPLYVQDYILATAKSIEWNDNRNEFKSEITTIVESVTTTGQLVNMWPEAEQYLPPFASDPSKAILLPALKTSRLNALLGIK
jgi:hypothetical protein